MWGQGLRPAAWHPMAGAAPKQDLARYIAMNAAETRGMVDALDDHGDFIARVCGAPEPAGA